MDFTGSGAGGAKKTPSSFPCFFSLQKVEIYYQVFCALPIRKVRVTHFPPLLLSGEVDDWLFARNVTDVVFFWPSTGKQRPERDAAGAHGQAPREAASPAGGPREGPSTRRGRGWGGGGICSVGFPASVEILVLLENKARLLFPPRSLIGFRVRSRVVRETIISVFVRKGTWNFGNLGAVSVYRLGGGVHSHRVLYNSNQNSDTYLCV